MTTHLTTWIRFDSMRRLLGLVSIATGILLSGCEGQAPVSATDSKDDTQVASDPVAAGSPQNQGTIGKQSYYLSYFGKTKSNDAVSHWVCLSMDGPTTARREFCDDPAYSDPPLKIFPIDENHIEVDYLVQGSPSSGAYLRLKSDPRVFLEVFYQNEYRLGVHEFNVAPSNLNDNSMLPYRFKLHQLSDGSYGEKRYAIESMWAPGYYVGTQGTLDQAKGVRLDQYANYGAAFAWSFFVR